MREVIGKIKNAHSVAVLPHIHEDADALGSCFAFAKMIRKMGKKATVYVSGRIESRLDFMGNDYVLYEKNEKYSHDLCACLDCGDIERIKERKIIFDAIGNSVNIDHHMTNTMFADANYVDGTASATGEILFRLFEEMKEPIDADIAKDLYTAICSDTGCFKYSNTKPDTLRVVAGLMEYGFDHAEIVRLLFDSESLSQAKLKAEITENIKSYAEGKISLVYTDEAIGEKYGMSREDIPNLVEIPRRIENTEIAVCIKRTDDGYRVNLRSNGEADVAKAAIRLGGGGHVKAAGATICAASRDEAERMVLAACENALEEIS